MFEDALRRIRELQRKAAQLDGDHELRLDELFPDEFMLRNTELPSIEAFMKESGFSIESDEDFSSIPEADWNDYIQERTRFSSWEEMKRVASEEWALRQLDLG